MELQGKKISSEGQQEAEQTVKTSFSVNCINAEEEYRRLDEELEGLLDKDREFTYIEDPYDMKCLLETLGKREIVMHQQTLDKIHKYAINCLYYYF